MRKARSSVAHGKFQIGLHVPSSCVCVCVREGQKVSYISIVKLRDLLIFHIFDNDT